MSRVVFLTDFTEAYAHGLLKGFVQYSKENTPWVLCRMPMSYRDMYGIEGVLEWAKRWKADGIVSQFRTYDPVHLFKEAGIVAMAQDYKQRFDRIPNITGDYRLAGRMGAEYYLQKGYKNFAFYGFRDAVWSEERAQGYRETIEKAGFGSRYYESLDAVHDTLWFYDSQVVANWLNSLPKPVALMTCDDTQGQHITEVCRTFGIRVPEEISILGVDNDEAVCNLSNPSLSSIELSVEKSGYEAAQLMDHLIRNPEASYKDVVVRPIRILTRQSTEIFASNDKHIIKVLKFIHQNYHKKISVDDIAELVPLSRRLLEMRFKEATGSPVYQYIFNLRMEKLAQLLLESQASVSELASQIGFQDIKNVARQFKSIKGCSPSEYRKTVV